MEKFFFEHMCAALHMGSLTEEPQQLSGGFLHKMYSVFTENGKYAVKLLNPFIMQRETAMGNFQTAEYFEEILEKSDVPILPALAFNGKKMQNINGQYFYVFQWFSGKALKPNEIREEHVKKIGNTLALIHKFERHEVCETTDSLQINWASYTECLLTKAPELGRMLQSELEFLEKRLAAANIALQKLSPVRAVCHNDMDPKNVLWCGEEHRVIDLECLSYGNPQIELTETALCWSGLDACRIDVSLFKAFVEAYREAGGEIPADWGILLDANCGRLGWLEYCIQRALGINCSAEEQILGQEGIYITLSQLHAVENHCAEITGVMSEMQNRQ